MRFLWNKWVLATVLVVVALGAGLIVFFVWRNGALKPAPVAPPAASSTVVKSPGPVHKVIGSSVQGRKIDAYTYGSGKTHLLFVGGIHGGYEWNSVLLSYMFMDYLAANPKSIPANLTVTVIPSANPDGVFKVIGKEGRFAIADAPAVEATVPGRFNAHGVDLNRNFACKWQSEAVWRGSKVGAGTAAFSEPEAAAIRDFVLAAKPSAGVFWHSQSGTVYASFCEGGILPQTSDIMNAYSRASGYRTSNTFDAYAVTGDAEGWLASIGIPAITVELTTHTAIEWEKNLAGVKALLGYYGQ